MLRPRERTIVTITLLILCAFSGYDLIEDFTEAGLYSVLIWDVIDFCITAAILGYICCCPTLRSSLRQQTLPAQCEQHDDDAKVNQRLHLPHFLHHDIVNPAQQDRRIGQLVKALPFQWPQAADHRVV